ncbi:MAG: ribose transport system ATP-binding protein [Halanaerobiales bacterium]|nr:ribose transport system ATP-binding protein [Halanaerobiales bacterium]
MADTLLRMEQIDKTFPGVRALSGVDFTLNRGEIKALVGENGAGKSTLIKILAGIYQADRGEIYFNGERLNLNSPHQAREAGLAFIHQDLNLVPYFNAVENIWLGFGYPRRGFRFARDRMQKRVKELMGHFNFTLDIYSPVSRLSTPDKWLVAILKAFMMETKLLVLDEPTAALTDKEVRELFRNLEEIKERGIGIIYISHRLEEIFAIADSVTVLKDGRKVADKSINEIDKEELINLMTEGKAFNRHTNEAKNPAKAKILARAKSKSSHGVILEVKNLKGRGFENISFTLNSGEVLGFYGLTGAGRTDTMKAIFGLEEIEQGEIILKGRRIERPNPAAMIENGLILIPEDRREEGLVLDMTVSENLSLPNLGQFLRFPLLNKIDKGKERKATRGLVDELDIKTPSPVIRVKYLSGGNQQKVVIGKWLLKDRTVFIFDEPTTGIDVGARKEIYRLIDDLSRDGGVIVISSDLSEIIRISDRVAVMSKGRIRGILSGDEISEKNILQLSYEGV